MGSDMNTVPAEEGSICISDLKKKKKDALLELPKGMEPFNTGQQSNSLA